MITLCVIPLLVKHALHNAPKSRPSFIIDTRYASDSRDNTCCGSCVILFRTILFLVPPSTNEFTESMNFLQPSLRQFAL